ncbi:WRKY transcription factor 19 [Phytophthora cinnamomi]|uniref:WRKY transcription factor 19 n=1 Tax=Phytophthora cinnamomi TaxID=4785 RepID=UPI00355A36F4|nr:WRKY transcription factor 19 [Phytophthora cinnamomi]
MEWNNSRFQLPSSQSPFLQRPARPRYWYYNNNDDDEDEETREIPQHDVIFRPSRFGSDGVLLPPPPSIPSLKLESSSAHNGSNNCDNGSMLLQSFSSLGMPQLEESTEFQPFFPSQSSGFSGSAFLQPSQQQPPTLPELQQQPSEQFSTPQFGQYPSVMTSYYAPAMPLTPPPPVLQSTIRPSADYFPKASQLFTACTALFRRSLGTHDMPSDNSPLEYSAAEPMHDAKKRGGGRLTAPFTSMTTVQEPKFSPDKRKLCCVEGCKSQARAFNRCKRHGGSKRCSSPGCTKSVQSRGLCIRHGGALVARSLGALEHRRVTVAAKCTVADVRASLPAARRRRI